VTAILAKEEVEALGELEQEAYEECDGEVTCYYSYDHHAQYRSGWPSSEEFIPEVCDRCGNTEWTDDDADSFREARSDADD
jgi:hypothetical protein